MSWFSLSGKGQEIFTSYSMMSGMCTGSIVGTYLFDRFVQPSYFQVRLRQAAEGAASRVMASKIKRLSDQASDRFLEISLTKGKWQHLRGKLKQSFMQDPKEYLLLAGKIGTQLFKQKVKSYVRGNPCTPRQSPDNQMILENAKNESLDKKGIRFFPGSYTTEEAEQIKHLLKQRDLKKAIYQAAFFNLKPTCYNAIRKAMDNFVKKNAGGACDVVFRKGLIVACMPTIYAAALYSLQWAAKQCGEETYNKLNQAAEMVPSPYTILTLSAMGHAVEMTRVVWQARQASRDASKDKDKEEVKQTVLNQIKDSATQSLMNNQFLVEIGLTKDPEKIKNLVETLVFEAIELYWDDLHQKRILGLPLVA